MTRVSPFCRMSSTGPAGNRRLRVPLDSSPDQTPHALFRHMREAQPMLFHFLAAHLGPARQPVEMHRLPWHLAGDDFDVVDADVRRGESA